MHRRKTIPDRWLDYSSVGTTVAGTRIIPFKTPLIDSVFFYNNLEKWTPQEVVNQIPNLGLVINLCFARNPYYNVKDFKNLGVDYAWIPCPGQVVPDSEVVEEFTFCVEEFLSNEGHYSNLLGVHCTHGVNRTGYIVSRYLVESLGFKPETAIQEFELARGHSIERQEYIYALQSIVKTI